jgi:hypothetical protein
MIENLIVGSFTIAVCLVMQCLFVAIFLRILIKLEIKQKIRASLVGVSSLLIRGLMIMLVGNLLQISIWALLFLGYGEFQDYGTAFYHSVVNFSTLGYGDIVMSEERRLLGALEAANGVLMFGLTTSLLYTVLTAVMRRGWDIHLDQQKKSDTALPQ